eukprot:6180889-Pleurochrysis_carterae.AAC.1
MVGAAGDETRPNDSSPRARQLSNHLTTSTRTDLTRTAESLRTCAFCALLSPRILELENAHVPPSQNAHLSLVFAALTVPRCLRDASPQPIYHAAEMLTYDSS